MILRLDVSEAAKHRDCVAKTLFQRAGLLGIIPMLAQLSLTRVGFAEGQGRDCGDPSAERLTGSCRLEALIFAWFWCCTTAILRDLAEIQDVSGSKEPCRFPRPQSYCHCSPTRLPGFLLAVPKATTKSMEESSAVVSSSRSHHHHHHHHRSHLIFITWLSSVRLDTAVDMHLLRGGCKSRGS